MTRIFISYRRTGDTGLVARLNDWLSAQYGAGNVFRDIGKLKTGEDFDQRILSELNSADVVIAAIGNAWTGARRFRRTRIRSKDDWVRKELENALQNQTPILPILIDGAGVPTRSQLPPSLLGVLDANIGRIEGANWETEFQKISEAIDPVTSSNRSEKNDPAVWSAVEIPPPSNAWKAYVAVASFALVIGVFVLWRFFEPAPLGVDLDDPATWTVPPVQENARGPVAVGALRLAIVDLQDSVREVDDFNADFNVDKYTARFGLSGVPWSAALTTWTYYTALQRLTNSAALAEWRQLCFG